MADEKDEQIRKTVSLTHKQAGLTAGGIAALTAVLVGPLSQFFQTKVDAAKQTGDIKVQAIQLESLKGALESNKKEINEALDSSKKEIIEAFNSVVKPIAKDVDRHEARIVNLEFIQMGGKRNDK